MTEPFTLRFPSGYIDYLRLKASETLINDNIRVSPSDIIRDAVMAIYPFPSGFNHQDEKKSYASGLFFGK